MKLFVDGKQIDVHNEVRVIYERPLKVDTHLVLNADGLVIDLVESPSELGESAIRASGSLTIEDLVETTVER